MSILDRFRGTDMSEQRKRATVPIATTGDVPAAASVTTDLEREVLTWRDKYVTRVDRDMATAFPQLEKTLQRALDQNLKMILLNRPRELSEKVLQPAIEAWIKRTTTPILNDAERDLTGIVFRHEELLADDFDISRLKLMLLPAGMTIAGVGLIISGFLAGITTGAFLVFWSSASVSWPVLIGTAAIGTALIATGAVQLSHVRSRISKAFATHFLPKVRECLIGEGYTVDKRHHSSVRVQLESAIARAARELLDARQSR